MMSYVLAFDWVIDDPKKAYIILALATCLYHIRFHSQLCNRTLNKRIQLYILYDAYFRLVRGK